jgi:hypothetical protein
MNAWQRVHAATLEMVGSAPIKQRLTAAYSNQLQYINPTDLPEELRGRFQALADAMQTVRPLPGETTVQATVRKMSPADADRCAAGVVELFGELAEWARQQGAVRSSRERREAQETVVPLFAAEA